MTRFNDSTVERFVDQELDGEERIAFIARLGRDSELRERVIALETLALTASTLPRPAVPDRFVTGVMARIDRTAPIWQRILDALVLPRSLQWNVASAAAAACLVGLAVWAAVAARGTPTDTDPRVSATAVPDGRPVLVRLVVVHPGATTVQVAGDFNGWNPASTALTQTSAGAWTITLPLAPGRYEYQFVIDGQTWIADPFATELNDDGFGSSNAVIDVRAPETQAGGTL